MISSRQALLLVALFGVAVQGASAADEKFAWKAPFELELPETPRIVLLQPGVDAAGFASLNGLTDARVLPLGRQGSVLEVAMDDAAWDAASNDLCADAAVAACETMVCQGIQLTGSAAPGSQFSAQSVQARLVKNPPEQIDVPDSADGEAGTCQGPALIPPLDQAAAAGSEAPLNIDLSFIDSDTASGGSGSSDERSFQFSVSSDFNSAGGVDLGTDDLPADTSEWMLVVGAGCTEVKIPLDSLEPARVPGLVLALVDAADVQPVAGTYGLTVLRQLALNSTGQNLVVYATAQNIFTVIAALAADTRVDGAQPEYVYRTTAESAAENAPAGIAPTEPVAGAAGYSDPFASLNYGPGMTGALQLHPSAAGSGQLVAVIDTGVDVSHPDLVGHLREPVDTTGEGYGAEVHGTAVAGIIAAEADNAIGSYGVAPAAEILPIKACHPQQPGGLSARCRTSSLVKALDVAIVENATIINMSLSGPPDDLLARFVYLAQQQDRLIIAGAGNGGENAKPGFPAALPGVLAVTAVDVADNLYGWANRGDYIDVAAPGVDIISSAPEGRYPPLSGTSMAAAHVTGVVALLKELVPLLSAPEIAQVIIGNARDLGTPGSDGEFGAGLVDACRSALAATAEAVICTGEDNVVSEQI